MYERLTKNKEIDATVHNETNFNKTPAFKKEDITQSLKGTIKMLENSIQDCKGEIAQGNNKDHHYGAIQGYTDAINGLKEMHPAIDF